MLIFKTNYKVINTMYRIMDIACSPENLLNTKKTMLVILSVTAGNMVEYFTFSTATGELVGTMFQWFAWLGGGIAGFATGIKYISELIDKRKIKRNEIKS